MNPEINILLITAASIGFFHTLMGPDHYLPFIVMAKARKWTTIKTLWVTFVCGLGHVASSILLGAVGIAMGIGVHKLEIVEAYRGNLAAWAFIGFGFLYFLWGMWKVWKNKTHHHVHHNIDGTVNVHAHTHGPETMLTQHRHAPGTQKPVNLTPWVLITIFVLGPCEPLIPILMYPAATFHLTAVVLVSLVFSVITISTMLAVVALSIYGFNFLPLKSLEKYMHPIAGATICLSGCAIVFLGL